MSAGNPLGLRVLIASLSEPSQENPGGVHGTGELGAWLNLVTGTGLDFTAEEWRRWFQSEGKNSDLSVRWPAVVRHRAAAAAQPPGYVPNVAPVYWPPLIIRHYAELPARGQAGHGVRPQGQRRLRQWQRALEVYHQSTLLQPSLVGAGGFVRFV